MRSSSLLAIAAASFLRLSLCVLADLGEEWGGVGRWANSSWEDPLGVFTEMICDYEVPITPQSYSQQSVFVWCAFEPARSGRYDMGVMQPEIDYGPNCMPGIRPQDGIGPGVDPAYDKEPYWYWSAQYVHPNTTHPVSHSEASKYGYLCHTGKLFKAKLGQRLVTNITYDPSTDAWLNYIYSPDTGEMSFFNATNPYMQPGLSWREFMASDGVKALFFVETYGVSNWRADMPLAMDWHAHYSLRGHSGAVLPASVQWEVKSGNPANLQFGVSSDGSGLISVNFHAPNVLRTPNLTSDTVLVDVHV